MMSRLPPALLRGRVAIRPWRVGLLVDVDDEAQVRDAIAALTGVWGGIYLPILDRNASINELYRSAEVFDLDCLYGTDADGDLEKLLGLPGYRWNGRGPWGPFSPTKGSMRKGLLLAEALEPDEQEVLWSGPNSSELIVDAYRGHTDSPESVLRPIAATSRHLRLAKSYGDPVPRGLCVARADTPRDIAWFWNCRALSGGAYPLAAEWAEFNRAVLGEVQTVGLPQAPHPEGVKPPPKELYVWGFDDLAQTERDALQGWASQFEVQIVGLERDLALEAGWFAGMDRVVSAAFRVETVNAAHAIHVRVPGLPLKDNDIYQGIVAAEVEFHEASGLDPRLSVAIPPFRRHAKLLQPSLARGADHARVSRAGPVFAIQTHADEVLVPTAYNLEIMGLLFDQADWSFSQSNEGQFQTRAAEMFGGALSGALAQPGLRAAIRRASDRPIGVVLDEIRRVIKEERGDWPDPVFGSSQSPAEYARRQANLLLNSGLLIPTLDVECAHCRVVSRVNPNDLAVTMQCEFCGDESRLALSLALTKPRWRYRLAAHLAAEKINAFLPVMAASSVLAGLFHVEGPPPSHIFGLTVTRPGNEPTEVDIAMILHEEHWTVVLGEVKSHHSIEADDINHLFSLQRALAAKKVPCILLFATLKQSFSPDEQELIRSAVEREKATISRQYQSLPLMPLLLTERDMSLPNLHNDHPWHWGTPGQGVVGIALESCKRNLGLASVRFEAGEQHGLTYEWSDTS